MKEKEEDKETKREKRSLQAGTTLFIALLVATVVIWGLSAIIIFYYGDTWEARGTMGDMFGAVNALFSGLAFAAILFTILLQREEIKMNRGEIELNRKELKKSAAAQQRSQHALKEQVVQTHLTAKINAMSTVINYYNNQISNPNNSPEVVEKARQKRRAMIQQIDELIDGLQDSEIEE